MSISNDIWSQLVSLSCGTGFKLEEWEIGAIALRDWLARNHPDTFGLPSRNGYQWKQLFLPNGTALRTTFGGKHFHAIVDKDQVIYEGGATSPSAFANSVGNGVRNAWRTVWILLPTEQAWTRAADLRPAIRRPKLGAGH
jgi:hypothetical protein